MSTTLCAKSKVDDYHTTYIPVYTKNGDFFIAIRVFKKNGIPSFLIVNTKNLKTSITPISQIFLSDGKNNNQLGDYTQAQISRTRYYKLLQKYTSEPYNMENCGITHAKNMAKGNILTIDMCQSSVFFEKDFFDQLAALATKNPIPVAISISGMWLLMHKKEFYYLVSLQKEKKLDITWVNHSFSHPYYDDLSYSKNFLLSEMTHENSEILLTEKYLLEEDQVPSVFFRFPGLISNKKLIMKLKYFGLLPLGADAWIAKNQPIIPGGIILVHGNGNEHDGIVKLSPQLKKLKFVNIRTNI